MAEQFDLNGGSRPADGGDDYATPPWLLDLLFPDGVYFDPCPLGKKKGGLEMEWPVDKPVFINPPYSDPLPWVKKASEHRGPIVVLVKDDPSTAWWDYSEGFHVTHIGQRLRFGHAQAAASFPSAIWRRA